MNNKPNAPPETDLITPENLPPSKEKNPGLLKNLLEQIKSIYKHCNEKSHKTRKRHYEATKRFCRFLADNYRLEKFKNVEDRHFRAYVDYLKESGVAPATIQSDLSGIRFFHRLSGSKNKLSKNNCLDIPKRAVGVENRAWLPEEKEKAVAIAERMGRTDVVIAIDLAYILRTANERKASRVSFENAMLLPKSKEFQFLIPILTELYRQRQTIDRHSNR